MQLFGFDFVDGGDWIDAASYYQLKLCLFVTPVASKYTLRPRMAPLIPT